MRQCEYAQLLDVRSLSTSARPYGSQGLGCLTLLFVNQPGGTWLQSISSHFQTGHGKATRLSLASRPPFSACNFFLPASIGSPGLASYSVSKGEGALRRAAETKPEPCCDFRAEPGLGSGVEDAQDTKLKEAAPSEPCKFRASTRQRCLLIFALL